MYYYFPSTMAIIKKAQNIKHWRRGYGTQTQLWERTTILEYHLAVFNR